MNCYIKHTYTSARLQHHDFHLRVPAFESNNEIVNYITCSYLDISTVYKNMIPMLNILENKHVNKICCAPSFARKHLLECSLPN